MTLNHYFDIKRFGYLLKREGFTNLKLFGVTLGGISGLLLIIFLITIYSTEGDRPVLDPWNAHPYFFIPPYLIIGIVFSSLAYRDLLQVNKAYAYLTLPVSNVERLLSMLLITTVVYTVFFVIYYMIFSLLLNGLGMILTDVTFVGFDFTAEPVVKAIKLYLVIQSIFLLGAAAFRKFPLIFTLLTLFIAALVMIVIGLLTVRIVFAEFIEEGFDINVPVSSSEGFKHFVEEDLRLILKSLFWYVLAPLSWVITYLKLKEREV